MSNESRRAYLTLIFILLALGSVWITGESRGWIAPMALCLMAFGCSRIIARLCPPLARALTLNVIPQNSQRDSDTALSFIVRKSTPPVPSPGFPGFGAWSDTRSIPAAEYREILSAMSEVILVFDAAGHYLQIAPTNPSLLYRPSEELIGKTLHQVFPKSDADLFLAQIRRALATCERTNFEYSLTINGAEIWFSASVAPLTNKTVLWVARDVTPKKRAEASLRANEERFRALVENSHDAVALIDAQGKLLYQSPSAFHVSGFTFDDRKNRPTFALIHPEDLPLTQKLFGEILRDPAKSKTVQIRIQHKNGTWRWIDATGRNRLGDPSIRAIVVNYHDVTEQKEREQELERRTLELGALFQIGQSLSRLAPLSEILETVYDAVGQALDNRNLYIALHDESKNEIHFPIYSIAGERRAPFGRALKSGITEYILRTRAPLFLPRDVDQGLQERGIELIGAPACSFLGVPLQSGGKTIGVMAIQDYEKADAYDTRALELFSTIASQVAGAIENARLYDQAKERADEFRALYQTTHTLTLGNDLLALLQSVVENAAALLNAPAGAIILHNAEQNVLEFSAVIGLPIPVGTRMPVDAGFAGKVFQTRSALAIEEYAEWEHRSAQFESLHLRALVGVPLVYRGEAIGVLQFGEIGDSTRKFTELDTRMLELFAGQAAGAVHSARLLAAARKRADEFAALYNSAIKLGNSQDLQPLLEQIVDNAASLLDAPTTMLSLYRPETQDLDVVVTKNFDAVPGLRLKLGQGIIGQVALKREAVSLDDYSAWEHQLREHDGAAIRAALFVPLVYSGELLGVLGVCERGDSTRKFALADERLLQLFAHQVAGAVQTARLLAETQKRAGQLALLNAITTAASGTLNLRDMLQILADRMGELFGAEGAYIALWDDEQKLTIPTAAYGPMKEIYPQQEPKRDLQTMTRSVLDAGHALAAEDVFASPYVSPIISARYPARSILGLPLIAGGKKLGAAVIGFSETHHFTPEEISFGEQAAGQIALAVAKARLYDESQQRAQEFETLHQVTQDLNSYKDLTELLQAILERATEIFKVPSGSITLYDRARGDLMLAAAKDFPLAPGARLPVGTGMAGIVAEKREPLIVADYQSWEHHSPSLDGSLFCAALCVPMIYRGELIGTLGIRVIKEPARKFSDADARLLSLFASQAASAVHNARLFEETKARADQMALLYDAGLTLNRVLDPTLQLKFLVKLAMQTLNADRAIFYRYHPTRGCLRAEMAVGYAPEILQKLQERQFSLQNEKSIPGWVLQSHLPTNLGEVTKDPRYIPFDPSIQSGLWVPIERESLPRGVLCVFSMRVNAFTLQDERLLTLYANQVSVAMGNAELFGEINQRLMELESLNKLSTALRAAHTRAEMLPLFLKHTLALFDTDAGVIWLDDPAQGVLNQAAASGWFTQIKETPTRRGEGIAGHVFVTGENHLSPEFVKDPFTRQSTLGQIPAGWGGACVPIRSGEEIVGVLFIAVPLPRELNEQQARLLTTLAEIAGNTIHRMQLHESLEQTFVQTVAALAHAIDARDAYTAGHSNSVSDLAVDIAAAIGLPRETQELIRLGGLLHDIGKIAIPDAILHKPSRLTPEEYALVKIHPKVGAQILEPIKQLREVVPIVLCHQERYDGTGYPAGLASEAIPIGARVLSVADAFTAITDMRAYRPARSKAEALAEIERGAGKQFDPRIVRTLKNILEKNS